MDPAQEKSNVPGVHPKHAAHRALAHSYCFYFIFLLLGVLLDLIFKVKIFESSVMMPVGLALLVIATAIICWAQVSYPDLRKENLTKEHFCRGPYCYVRNPTHFGLFILILGFGFLVNGFFIILTNLLSLFFTKFVSLKRYESVMLRHFGSAYEEYRKSVKM